MNRSLLIVAGGGILLYYLYSKGYLSAFMPGATTSTPVTTSSPNPTPTAAPGFNSLAAIYNRMVVDAGTQAQSTGLTADGWNYSLQRVAPANLVMPDPDVVFAGQDRNTKMTSSQYWGVVSPWLHIQYGLSGGIVYGEWLA